MKMGIKMYIAGTSMRSVLLLFTTLIAFGRSQDITFTQPESKPSGSFVGSIAATQNILNLVGESDRNSLQYSILTEGYENSQYFEINRNSGNITFNGEVDRETICPFTDDCSISFSVAVRGNNNFFSTFIVKVQIRDENDNSPKFPESEITIHILESANPSDFSRPLVTATDADRSSQYTINDYAIVPESPIFDVEFKRNLIGTPQVNLLLKQKLNREDEDAHAIDVLASDGGNPPRTGTLRVNIIVDDINDNDPLFSQTFYTANFSENMGPDYIIIRVSASDEDSGDNGRVTYFLSNTPNTNIGVSGKISVNSTTGQVILLQSLSSGVYDILIDAHDNGTPRKSAQAVVKVNVLDTSNNKPVVTVNAVQLGDLPLGYVSENESPSAVVAVLNVDDTDSGKNGNVTCETTEPHFQLQQLQTGSFKLMVAKPLDRETNATHEVSVTCKDQGTPSLNDTAVVTIRVVDENDNSPAFTQPLYVQNIFENNVAGEGVTFANAFDIDDGDNALLEYELEGEDGNFLITPDSGVIKATRSFNRENKSRYEFQVLAIDHGSPRRTGTASVIINIKDINDVPPIFTKQSYKFYLYENRDAHSIAGNISVSDPDEDQGGVVSLYLSPMREGEVVPFEIDQQGRVSSLYTFDREVQESYSFYVIGKDNGQRQLSSSALIVVDILDVNDNKPTFMFPTDQNDSAFINIPIKIDQVISQVNVRDYDIKKNGIITYNIVSTNNSDLFRIGKFSGEIISVRDLGHDDMGTFSITVNATDQGFPVMWQARTLNIVVQSESTKKSDVIADQNVLIVACIVCFTIIVSGAVMVAMCVLRRMDRQKKMQYAATHSDNRPDSDNGSLPDHNQQYDLAHTSSKHDHPNQDKGPSPYHQQPGHAHFLSNGNQNNSNNISNSNIKRSSSSDNYTNSHHGGFVSNQQQKQQRQGDNSNYQSEPPPFYLIGPNGKVPDTNVHRHDDFQSTSSAETATGDSGHGSDEDLSNSMDQSNPPTVSMEPSINLSMLNQPPNRSNRRSSDSTSIQSKSLLPSSKNRPPSSSSSSGKIVPKNKGNSVRFDPRVTDIYENKNKDMDQFHAKLYFTGGNSNSKETHMGKVYPQTNNAPKSVQLQPQQPLRQTLPYSKQDNHLNFGARDNNLSNSNSRLPSSNSHVPQHNNNQQSKSYELNSNSLRLHSMSPRRHNNNNVSSILTPSSNFNADDANDESDLNTTTSGSYSVASDDVAREAALMMSNDMYV